MGSDLLWNRRFIDHRVTFHLTLEYDLIVPRSLADFVKEALETVPEVTPQQTALMAAGGEWTILDVREPEEYAEGHIQGSINVPRGFLEVKADLEHSKRDPRLANRSQKIVCYCGGGNRSALAAKTLLEMGFEQVVSMAGGWRDWSGLNLPVSK